MGCDIYNYKVLKIQHTENNVTLDEIIVLDTDKIYLNGIQYEEEYDDEDFLHKNHWTSFENSFKNVVTIYDDDAFLSTEYDEKYRTMIQERISENIEYYGYRYPLNLTMIKLIL